MQYYLKGFCDKKYISGQKDEKEKKKKNYPKRNEITDNIRGILESYRHAKTSWCAMLDGR